MRKKDVIAKCNQQLGIGRHQFGTLCMAALIVKIQDVPGVRSEELGRLTKHRVARLIDDCRLALLNPSLAVEEIRLNVRVCN